MEHQITLQFWKVVAREASTTKFSDALKTVAAVNPLKARERDVGGLGAKVVIRLERFAEESGYLIGEFVRRQTEDLPPEATDDSLKPLTDKGVNGLGHRTAFRYWPKLGIILLQVNRAAASVRRLGLYLHEFDKHATYDFEPVSTEDAWERFKGGVPRRLIAKIATPGALEAVEGPTGAVISSMRSLADIYGGAVITIEVTMGRKKGSLLRKAVQSTMSKLAGLQRKGADIRELTVGMSLDEGAADNIDFLEEHLVARHRVDLPSTELDKHYGLRKGLLETSFDANMKYLEKVYGKKK